MLLSHIPMRSCTEAEKDRVAEGLYCYADGSLADIETQSINHSEIKSFLEQVFEKKETLSLKDFEKLSNGSHTEMFLSLMVVLQERLPCSIFFNREYSKFKSQQENMTNPPTYSRPKVDRKHHSDDVQVFSATQLQSPTKKKASDLC